MFDIGRPSGAAFRRQVRSSRSRLWTTEERSVCWCRISGQFNYDLYDLCGKSTQVSSFLWCSNFHFNLTLSSFRSRWNRKRFLAALKSFGWKLYCMLCCYLLKMEQKHYLIGYGSTLLTMLLQLDSALLKILTWNKGQAERIKQKVTAADFLTRLFISVELYIRSFTV